MTTELDRPAIELPARLAWGPEQITTLKNTVAKGCTPAEFEVFCELASRYQLDPFAKQIWAAKMGGDNKPISIIVGRDGYLAIAERHPAYQGMDGDVVRKGDRFNVIRTPQGIEVDHQYGEDRQEILGAWAMVYRTDRVVPMYFFAPIKDYKPTGNKLSYSPWSKQESVMMLKCAQSTALRLAFNVSGFVPAEEAGVMEDGSMLHGAIDATSTDPDTFDWGDDDPLAERLRGLFVAANETRDGAFRPAKIRTMLRGKSHAERLLLAKEVEEFIRRRGGTVPGEVEGTATEVKEDDPEGDAEPEKSGAMVACEVCADVPEELAADCPECGGTGSVPQE
jgi:phage recombination protein Bet